MCLGSLSSPPSGGNSGLGVVLTKASSVSLAIPEEGKGVEAGGMCLAGSRALWLPRSLGLPSRWLAALHVILPPL